MADCLGFDLEDDGTCWLHTDEEKFANKKTARNDVTHYVRIIDCGVYNIVLLSVQSHRAVPCYFSNWK